MEKIQRFLHHPVMQFLKKLCGDPVQLYIVLLVTTIMHYYHSDFTWMYLILSIPISWVMIRFYDFVNRHPLIGPLCDIAYMAAGLFIVGVLTDMGRAYYPISFFVWFLTPQSVMTFSGWYTAAIYLLMLGFLSSAVYYFARVRYRMVMQFLIMLIPLCMYAKEGIQAPAFLVMLTLSSYFLLMIYCRQLHGADDIRRLNNLHTGLSIAAYVLAFSIIAAVFPKAKVQADREYIENVMAYSSWSDVLMSAISMFTNSTDGGNIASNNARTMYYIQAPEPLLLRTQTFSNYQADDTWTTLNEYDMSNLEYRDLPEVYTAEDLLEGILLAAELSPTFAASYGLSEEAGMDLPEQTLQQYVVVPAVNFTSLLPTPTRTTALAEWIRPSIAASQQRAMQSADRVPLQADYPIVMHYYSDRYAKFSQVEPLLTQLQAETYAALLNEAAAIVQETNPETAELLLFCAAEQEAAYQFLNTVQGQDYASDALKNLAAELTEGLTSDYEKARAIERYFTDAGFIYDLTYIKAEDANIDTFLFTDQRGVCYEFATAMVLMCRSVGLPARFATGYNMSERYESEFHDIETNYLVKIRDSHAFPEVYISGYGWLSFEPTVASNTSEGSDTSEHINMMFLGLGLLGLVLLALAGYLLFPRVKERWFQHRLRRMPETTAAAALFAHMRKYLSLPESATVMELAQAAELPGQPEHQTLFIWMDGILYGDESTITTAQLGDAYVRWLQSKKTYEKERSKKKGA